MFEHVSLSTSMFGLAPTALVDAGDRSAPGTAGRAQPLLATDQPMQIGGLTPAIARMAAGTVQMPSPAMRPAICGKRQQGE